jgi:hypothetical protein
MSVACRTCPSCQTNWPISGYGLCPVCRTPTRYGTDRAIPSTDIDRTVKALKFERYYSQRESERVKRGDPSPEELGTQDALKQLKGDRGEKQEV